MSKKDPRVDAYIAKSADFARPILVHIREVVHAACPEVQEDIKWTMPAFMYEGILCQMAAFKQHAVLHFRKSALIRDADGKPLHAGFGQNGKLTKISDLPPKKVLADYVKQAMKLNQDGAQPARKPASAKSAVAPADFKTALAKNRSAAATFEKLPPSHRRDYVEWIVEAKREETRKRRIATAIELLAEGKTRNWRYQRK